MYVCMFTQTYGLSKVELLTCLHLTVFLSSEYDDNQYQNPYVNHFNCCCGQKYPVDLDKISTTGVTFPLCAHVPLMVKYTTVDSRGQ